MRRLHEHHHVSLAELSELCEYTTGTVEKMADVENWQAGGSAGALRVQLGLLLQRALAGIEGTDDEIIAAERTLRHAGTMAKAIETLAAAQGHLAKADRQTENGQDDDPFAQALAAGASIAELDQLAARLVLQLDPEGPPTDHGAGENIHSVEVAADRPT